MTPQRTRGLLGAAALLAAGWLVTPAATPVAAAADCPDAEVVFARGTNEPAGLGRVGNAFVDALRQQTHGMNIGTYGVKYNASKLQIHTGDGANDVVSHVKSVASSCPSTKIVLGGYSQGADVIDIVSGVPIGGISWGSALPPEYASNVAAVAVFGDVADRSGQSLATQSSLFSSKVIDLCNPTDPICHAGPGNDWEGHTEGYVPVYTTQAATFVAARLMAGTGQPVFGFGPPQMYGPQTPGYGPQSPVAGPQSPGSSPSIHGGTIPAPTTSITPSPQAPLV